MAKKKQPGRPTKYTAEIAKRICDEVSKSDRGLASICNADNMPCRATVHKWLSEIKEFSDKYARAKLEQADYLAEQILEIADDNSKDTIYTESESAIPNSEWINRSRLRVDARKWLASKLAPKKYGDRMEMEHSGELKTISETTIYSVKPKA